MLQDSDLHQDEVGKSWALPMVLKGYKTNIIFTVYWMYENADLFCV